MPLGPAKCLHLGDTITDGTGAGWTVVGNYDPSAALVMLMTSSYQETVGGLSTGAPLYFHTQDGNQALDLTGEGNQYGSDNGIKQSISLNPGTLRSLLLAWAAGQHGSRIHGWSSQRRRRGRRSGANGDPGLHSVQQ